MTTKRAVPWLLGAMALGVGVSGAGNGASGAEKRSKAHTPPAGLISSSLELDAGRSFVVAVTRREGLMGFMGHEHAILARRWSANVRYQPANPKASSVEIFIPVEAVEVDSHEARKAAEVDPDGPNADDLKKIVARTMGPDILDAAKYPKIEFQSAEVTPGEGRDLNVKGRLTLRGVTRDVAFAVAVEPDENETFRFFGSLKFKQSDFGITPISIAGVIKVKDEMEIRFSFHSKPRIAVASR